MSTEKKLTAVEKWRTLKNGYWVTDYLSSAADNAHDEGNDEAEEVYETARAALEEIRRGHP